MAEQFAFFVLTVFAINLLPAFGPPTWSIILLFGINSDLPLAALVGGGALAAASGRFILGLAFRFWGNRISERLRSNLDAVKDAFERKSRNTLLGLGLFALSPLPSAQLFAAAGLAGVRLLPFTLAFFAGRLVSYSIYGGSARLIESYSLGDAFRETLTSPVGIALQVLLLAGLVMLPRIDWAKRLNGSSTRE